MWETVCDGDRGHGDPGGSFLVLYPWAGDATTWCLSFLIRKKGVIIVMPTIWAVVRIK